MSASGFVYQAQPNRVVFGTGTLAQLGAEVSRLGVTRALILCTTQQIDLAQSVADRLGRLGAGLCARAIMHTPVEVTALAMDDLVAASADGIVSVGGGSTIGLGKALSIRTGLPHLAIPTTYAGSEMTPILGETQDGIKTTRRDPRILPASTLYDVDLTLGLPVAMSVTSGLNAIAHAVEALYAPDGNPIISLMAADAIRSLARALPRIVAAPTDAEARRLASYGAWLAGSCLGSVSMSIHHKLCHVLGGSFDLPHAETHAVILPHAVASIADAVPEAMEMVRHALGTEATAAKGLHDLARRVGAPTRLADIGMPKEGLDRAAELATASPYWTPVPLARTAIRALLERAFSGQI
ncbi:maleylacetate reductase [Chelatococcus asaccharovorans]|uniref:Maleylacetate reductase n=1 Tax=Chelatococcus asaccharovorans TaxID=28210 RepID=A0A2V3UJH0_9HYPH|nr:maleylacetate reductase [Chelatococcus asaccharovorans]MBS7706054.1 maleylacetate reductase [Chelatococcus asaccharovorans]PXW59078.1 maleylacetate reductase [Chelatococcus asaccharovorans]